MTDEEIVQAKKKWEEIQEMYGPKEGERPPFSLLLMGEWGVGKTQLIGTGRLPILIDSFDPNGVVVLYKVYPELMKSGAIQVRKYWSEDFRTPTEFKKWEKQWEEDIKSGYIGLFGTYAIDSFTTWMECAVNNWLRKKNIERGKHMDNLAQGDYLGLYNITRTMVKLSSAQGADFILTAHLEAEQDGLTQEITYKLATYKGLKTAIPPLFSEKLALVKEAKAEGVKYKLLTNNKARYRASNQLGANGVWDLEEEPNIRNLLKKAGLPSGDKPLFWKEKV